MAASMKVNRTTSGTLLKHATKVSQLLWRNPGFSGTSLIFSGIKSKCGQTYAVEKYPCLNYGLKYSCCKNLWWLVVVSVEFTFID